MDPTTSSPAPASGDGMAATPLDVQSAITRAVVDVSKDPNTKLDREDSMAVAISLIERLGPLITYATNNEGWYKSRIVWAQLVMIGLSIASLLGYSTDAIQSETLIVFGVAGSTIVGAVVTLIARRFAKKPIGS